ncbi:nck-associated protein 5-like [Anguilla anguilla]|uniref:nck-associated protein 5-like n=1 Tax=Anguilla anguilla TaxID=7936 RepID=UPI0015A8633E|nr:nck-associated protein 5-like [Anguilla anguilla]XP_035237804.1 nck-associated protein 5-like [Anguilla anguilla]XP_035237805.1 nck-associated protein 5-like [Anguilla anguilla]XP_035237806.1 nck-associated protein 5-like [Anguilla anguilla]XP_035237807.1 nck-associated protein 5-like [Anguilla anguilla]XP_035237808.1 nck-associated protein 5-like [Anguilla anguilla]
MMSEEVNIQDCEEASEAEEGDIEPYLEGESGTQFLERLQELEAENSALALANESQREAYERCLDEVANHVVQALLNQKDLREECIKLKMRVFELERQNQTLSELLHQKLHSHLGPCQQGGPTVQHRAKTPPTVSANPAGSACQTSTKSDGEHTRNGTSGARGPALSLDALSPFLQKKAHILEVLRKLEETDPLKFHPSAGLSSYSDFSQALFSADTTFATASCPPQLKVCCPLCLHSCSDSASRDGKGEGLGAGPGEGRPQQQSCRSCQLLAHRSLQELLARTTAHSTGVEVLDGLVKPETKVAPVPNSVAVNQPCAHRHSLSASTCAPPTENGHKEHCSLPKPGGAVPHLADQNGCTHGEPEAKLSLLGEVQSVTPPLKERHGDGPPICKPSHGDPDSVTVPLGKDEKHARAVAFQSLAVGPEECFFSVAAEVAKVKNSLYAATSSLPVPGCARVAYCKREAEGLSFSSSENFVSKKAGVEPNAPHEKGGTAKQPPPPAGKYKLALLPTSTSPSCLNESKPSPISSPSRLLKFLKIPSIGDRAQAANPLRLSPQLTRSSKIPCRSNNYEVYLSPATTSKAASSAERARQPPPSSSPKTDLYPATHSAPTSLPKAEDASAAPTNDAGYGSHLAPKASQTLVASPASQTQPAWGTQKVPHYENLSELAVPCTTPHFLSGPEYKDPLQEKRLSPPGEEGPRGLATPTETPPCDTKPADRGDGEEGAACYQLHSHHSLPVSSAVHQSQSSCSRFHTSSSQSQSVAKGTEPHPALENPPTEKLLGESGHQPFQERLAALGKLKSAEDLRVDGVHSGSQEDGELEKESTATGNEERSQTAERKSEHDAEEEGCAESTDSPDDRPCPQSSLGEDPAKLPAPGLPYGPGPGLPAVSAGSTEQEAPSPRTCATMTAESPKVKAGLQPSNPDPPQVLRNYARGAATQNRALSDRAASGPHSSPSKAQCKPGQSSSQPRTAKPFQDECSAPPVSTPAPHQKLLCRPEDRTKLTANRKKGLAYLEGPPPVPPRPVDVAVERRAPPAGPQSAIEQKVMKGIEENMLRLQVQDRGQPGETKQRASNGIASWFGLRKSKLPALSRKSDAARPKEDRREWRLVSSSSSSSSSSSFGSFSKTAGKQKVETEGLNISKLMEKAEDLRKALEEEQAFVNGVALDRPSRGHSCEVVMDPAQGQLSVMYRGVASENFMQQLLNRVDVKDGGGDMLPTHRRLSFDSKKLRPVFGQQRNGIVVPARSREEVEMGAELASNDDVTADKGLVDSMNRQRLAGCGASTHTLDSGIGTFPLPDYTGCAAVKSIPMARPRGEHDSPGKQGPTMKVPHKARTLDRELTSLEEVCPKQGNPNSTSDYGSAPEGKGSNLHLPTTIHEDEDPSKPSKNWTFPHLKASAVPTEMYLGVNEEVRTGGPSSPFRRLFVTSCDRNLL